eukprot:CAMPEP_0176208312 /NCGR_PEP_ID=MMETSP0121_2-20121125/13057_1 /TAXON_ID=160619 /ORGANISM="Kryptoperidinium foliaceum, Strain CCMP 1326" /LENGTH=123 /DNA_ID=CAMNT_0017547297 /DNA_START=366 /DNA_END=734 /DNA_ORIENTATION=+
MADRAMCQAPMSHSRRRVLDPNCPRHLMLATSSGDHRGRVTARGRRQAAELHGDRGQGLHHVEGMQPEVPIRRHVLLKVQANRRTGHASAREPENNAGAVREDEADALILRDAAVHRVQVLED